MASKYYTSALTKVAGSSTQFRADIYLADASNVGAYGVELVINGEPAGVSYSYTAAAVSGFSSSAGAGISAFSSSTTVGGTFATSGALIGTITVSFATAPSAAFKLAVVGANLDDIDGNLMTVSWDAFALYDPSAGNPPADTTPPVAPTVILASDTGTNTGDGITSSGLVNVTGLESGATWQYSANGGALWTTGTGSSFTLTGDGTKSVTVRQTDAAGNVGAASTALAFTLDAAAPTLSSASPSDNSTAVAVGNNIVLTFSESVAVGTGNIVISNGADTRTISVTDSSQVTLSGTQVTINPTADLLAGSGYNVQMASGAIKDLAGNAFAGIADSTTLNFGVQSANPTEPSGARYYVTALTKVGTSTTQFSADIYLANASNVVLYAVELQVEGNPSGVSYVYTTSPVSGFGVEGGTAIAGVSEVGRSFAESGTKIGSVTVTFAVAPTASFKLTPSLTALVDANNVLVSASWDAFALYDPNTGNPPADTTPPIAPVINAVATDNIVNAAEKAAGVTVSGTAETGSSVLVSWGAVSKTVAAPGGNWSTSFSSAEVPADAASTTVNAVATDVAGNASAAGTKAVVVDAAAPTLSSASPADNSTAVAVGNNIVLTFSESVAVGTGNIVISNGADTRTISVTDSSQVTLSGTQVTINPTADLLAGSSYNVQLASGAIKDLAGNAFAGISDATTLNFGTASVTPTPTGAHYYATTPVRVAGSSTQFTADIYLAGASNVGAYGVELEVNGKPAGASYSYTAASVSGFSASAGVGGISAFSSSTTVGGTFATSGALIGTITVSFATAPSAAFKLAVVGANLDDIDGNLMTVSWDAFALYDPNTGNPPADTTPPVAPTLSLNDTGVMGTDGITKIGTLNVVGLESGATWQYSTNGGVSWLAGSGTSFTLSGDGAKSVTVRQTDAAGNVGAASSALSFTLDTVSTTPVINSVSTDNIVNAAEKAAGVTVSGTAETGSSVLVSWGAVSKTVAAPGGNWSASFSSAEVPANAASTTISAVATDVAGNASAAGTKAVVVDAAAPTLSSASPADNSTAAAVGNNIVLTFSETVVARSGGTIELMTDYGSGHQSVEVFSVGDATRVTINGNVVTIDPTSALLPSTGYHLGFNSALADNAGNDFSYPHGQYNFTTAAVNTAGKTADITAYSWKAHTLLSGVSLNAAGTSHSGTTDANGAVSFTSVTDASLSLTASRAIPSVEATATTAAVNLQDAIAILKMIVGLDVNGAGKALSPYQALAADYDGNGAVQLTDAIGVLKHVVGLTAPQPAWHFVNELDTTVPGKANLSPGTPQTSISANISGSSPVHVGLVGYLSGDVDGSFAGAAGALDLDTLQSTYFNNLTSSHGLNLSQFGVYSV